MFRLPTLKKTDLVTKGVGHGADDIMNKFKESMARSVEEMAPDGQVSFSLYKK